MHCTAHTRQQRPCGNDAMKGSNVCRMHGGSAPQVKAAAQKRLLAAVDPLVARLLEIGLDQTEPVEFECYECGTKNVEKIGIDTRAALVAIRDALDRAGLGAVKQVEISIDEAASVLDAEIARLEAELALND